MPFRQVYIHALVRDADRQKMSKTKGNVIDPLEIIQRFGTDATRFTLAAMAAPGTDIAFSESRTDGYRAFANKIWNAARFMFMNVDRAEQAGVWKQQEFLKGLEAGLRPALAGSETRPHMGVPGFQPLTLEDHWILSRFHRVTKDVNEAWQTYRFHEAANRIYDFFWGDFCDWYIELMKPRLAPENGAEQASAGIGVRQSGQFVRSIAAASASGHAIYHGRNLARGLRWSPAAEINRAGRLPASR